MRRRSSFAIGLVSLSIISSAAMAAEPAACLSPDPSQWPAAARPYFLIIADSSLTMGTTVGAGLNSCGFTNNRNGNMRCAIRKLVLAYGGQVNFGLMTFPSRNINCAGTICPLCDETTGCFAATCTSEFTTSDDFQCGRVVQDTGINAALNTTNPGGAPRTSRTRNGSTRAATSSRRWCRTPTGRLLAPPT